MQAHTRLSVVGAGTKPKVLHRLSEHPDPSLPSEVLSDMHLLPDHETTWPQSGQTVSLDKWFCHQQGSSKESSFGTRLESKDKKRHPISM